LDDAKSAISLPAMPAKTGEALMPMSGFLLKAAGIMEQHQWDFVDALVEEGRFLDQCSKRAASLRVACR
jgi:hypothetical protein